ncbi:MAG TPA: hypothetical protein VKB63_00735 [Gemmatimonadales bacterium]|nr:hypothetical protein [Gemmatimonadales bacterium]
MVRSLAGIILGFFTIVILVLVTTPIAVKLLLKDPAGRPTAPYLIANLLFGLGSAAAGGWVAGAVAGRAPLLHAGILGGLILALGLWTAAQGGAARAGQPIWYGWTLPFVGAVGAVLGGAAF